MGSTDRYIRFMLGLGLLVNAIILDASRAGMFFIVLFGAVMVVTSFTGFCPLYVPLKLCTHGSECDCCKEAEAKAK